MRHKKDSINNSNTNIMKRLTIHLKNVKKEKNKIKNTFAFEVKNEKEINDHLNKFSHTKEEISKYYLSNIK